MSDYFVPNALISAPPSNDLMAQGSAGVHYITGFSSILFRVIFPDRGAILAAAVWRGSGDRAHGRISLFEWQNMPFDLFYPEVTENLGFWLTHLFATSGE